jgi:hypothetical protein
VGAEVALDDRVLDLGDRCRLSRVLARAAADLGRVQERMFQASDAITVRGSPAIFVFVFGVAAS